MACRKYHLDESIVQPPTYVISKTRPKGNPDPRIVADLKKKLNMK